MQLYHHPCSVDSQRVRLTLEEKGIDYTPYRVNPLTGKNMDSSFFRMNPTGKLPVFQNGSQIMFDTMEIILYIDRIAVDSSRYGNKSGISAEAMEWMKKVQQWNHSLFTLFHVSEKRRLFVSRFRRRVIIARMAQSPDLASAYHEKLKEAYRSEEKMRDPEARERSGEHLNKLLDLVELQLQETKFLAGEDFTVADAVFIPVLARLVLLNLGDHYIVCRPNVSAYWNSARKRPSYKKVIGAHFDGWRKHLTLTKTWSRLWIRNSLGKY